MYLSMIIFISINLHETLSNRLAGFNVNDPSIERQNKIVVINAFQSYTFSLFGDSISQCIQVAVVLNTKCNNFSTNLFDTTKSNTNNKIITKIVISTAGTYYFCLKCNGVWIYQGEHFLRTLIVKKSFIIIPIWLLILISVILIIFSGLFSGMNLSLMTLQPSSLKLIMASGNKKEKKYSKLIYPIRRHGNVLLCSLLLGNVLVNSTLTLCLDTIFNSYFLTLFVSTFGIVIFGEIIPQAFGARYSLQLSAYTIWLSGFFMLVTFILSIPIGVLLNKLLGQELHQQYSKDKLKLLIKEQEKFGCVVSDEIDIMSGALALQEKTVINIMTPISNAFMLSNDDILDYNTMRQIAYNGFTRIPIYSKDKSNITGILNIKDLTFVDPDDNIPVSTVCMFYRRQMLKVSSTKRLPDMLREFRQGKAHLALVESYLTNMNGKEEKTIVGLVTLEDVIEEIIQDEIVDETDMFMDNSLCRKIRFFKKQAGEFEKSSKQYYLSPQLYCAVSSYLSLETNSFRPDLIKDNVLQSLLKSKILFQHFQSIQNKESNILISQVVPLTSVILIVQGKVSITVSKENISFEGGPFLLLGETIFNQLNSSLIKLRNNFNLIKDMKSIVESCHYYPDYTVRSLTNLQYVSISAPQYLLARHLSHTDETDHSITNVEWKNRWSSITEGTLSVM